MGSSVTLVDIVEYLCFLVGRHWIRAITNE